MSYWRPIFYRSTGADTDGIAYVNVPNDREYKVIALKVTYERSSDITYTAALAPLMEVITTTSVPGSANQGRVLARYESIATMTADTVQSVAYFQDVVPAGDTYANVAIATQNFYVPIPKDLIISTEMQLKVYTNPSTGGDMAVLDLEGLFYIRSRGGSPG